MQLYKLYVTENKFQPMTRLAARSVLCVA